MARETATEWRLPEKCVKNNEGLRQQNMVWELHLKYSKWRGLVTPLKKTQQSGVVLVTLLKTFGCSIQKHSKWQ